MNNIVGITSYGVYVPGYRLRVSDIATVWKKDAGEIIGSLGVTQKSVPAHDEDAVTIAIESASRALRVHPNTQDPIEALFVGSESHPYAVNPTSTIIGELLGLGHAYLASDLEFACKAGTAGIQAVAGLVASGQAVSGLAIGTDAAQSKTHDALEYTSAAAGVAVVLGTKNVAASLVSYTSYSSDTPDFWRRDGIRFPSHAGRFTGEPAYFAHVIGAAMQLFAKAHIDPGAVDYCVFHMPNGKFPRQAAKRLGFTKKQLEPSLTVDSIGNPYSASSMMGLAAVLDIVKPGQTIMMVSYGSGAGSDAFLWKITDAIIPLQKKQKKFHQTVKMQIDQGIYIDYAQYLKYTHKI